MILLCRKDHKIVDDQCNKYSVSVLRELRKKHEKWVSEKLNYDPFFPDVKIKRLKENVPERLRRLTNGEEVLSVISNAHSMEYTYDEVRDYSEVEEIGLFLNLIEDGDLSEILRERVEFSFRLTMQLEKLNEHGFWVFGEQENRLIVINGEESTWTVAIIAIKRATDDKIPQ